MKKKTLDNFEPIIADPYDVHILVDFPVQMSGEDKVEMEIDYDEKCYIVARQVLIQISNYLKYRLFFYLQQFEQSYRYPGINELLSFTAEDRTDVEDSLVWLHNNHPKILEWYFKERH
jgi:hypothetical protein